MEQEVPTLGVSSQPLIAGSEIARRVSALVAGYGLDYAQCYRHLPDIRLLETR